MKKTIKLILIISILFSLFPLWSFSQSVNPGDYNSWSAGLKFGMLPFYGDVRQSKSNTDNKNQTINGGVSFEGIKNFNEKFGARADVLFGSLSGSSPDLNLYFHSNIKEYTVSGIVNLGDLFTLYTKREKRLNVYIYAGFGLLNFRSKLNTYSDNSYVNAIGWDSLGLTKTRSRTEFVFPLGMGMKFKVNPKIDLGLEYTIHLTNTDKLDANMSGLFMDRFGYAAISFTYKIGNKKENVDWVNPMRDTTTAYAKAAKTVKKNEVIKTDSTKTKSYETKNNEPNDQPAKTTVVAAPAETKTGIQTTANTGENKEVKSKEPEQVKTVSAPDTTAVVRQVPANADKSTQAKNNETEKVSNVPAPDTIKAPKQPIVNTDKSSQAKSNEPEKTTKVSSPDTNTTSKQTAINTDKNSQKAESEKKVNDSAPDEKKATKQNAAQTETVTEKNFYIIIGAFQGKKFAKEAVEKLVEKGYSEAEIIGKNSSGNLQVSAKSYATKEEAIADYASIKKTYPNAKLLKKENSDKYTEIPVKAVKPQNPNTTKAPSTEVKKDTVAKPKSNIVKTPATAPKPKTNTVKVDSTAKKTNTVVKPVATNQPNANTAKPKPAVVKTDTVAKKSGNNVKPAVTNQAAANTAKPKTTVVKTDTVVKQSSGNAKPTAAVKPPVTQPKPVVIKPATKPDSVKTKQDKVTAAKDTTKGTVKKAYIIAGTYHTIQEANDAVKILIQKGFNEAGIAGKNKDGYFLVSYRSFKSSGVAKVDLSMIKRLIDPSAWIYEEK